MEGRTRIDVIWDEKNHTYIHDKKPATGSVYETSLPWKQMIVVPTPPMTFITRIRDLSADGADKPEDFPFPLPSRTTTASYHNDPLPGISKTPSAFLHHGASWKLTLPIPVPTDILKPTLASLRYMIKYGTRFDDGNSTIQSDVVLSLKNFDRTALVTVSAVKCNGGSEQWSHFVDGQELHPNIRLVDPTTRLYFIFNAAEYPTKDTERFLALEITASWFEDKEARAEKEEADRLAAKEAEEQAKREAEIAAKEEAEKDRKAQEELERKIDLEVAKRVAEAESRLRAEFEESTEISPADAPAVADAVFQEKIKNAAEEHDQTCDNGFAWVKEEDGYRCTGRGHFLSWAQLGMLSA
ncbi:hypothetical protein ONZ45_g17645 [Pleurotus djamor]|nr:hypothetical protein ONZ45_g17645 [Pleurotus djamor]